MKFPMCTLSNIVSPGMYVVVSTDKEHVSEVKDLEEDMTENIIGDDASEIDLSPKMCVAVFFKDKLVRGVIEKELYNGFYEVVLMDYGHIIKVKKSGIRIITNEEYIKVEPLAFIVKLYGLIPTKYVLIKNAKVPKALKDWNSESQSFVRSFFRENHKIVVQSILIQQRTVYGDLFIKEKSKKKYISLRKLLCKNEFCAYSESLFLKHEELNDPIGSVEFESKMEMVQKWQEENFGQFKKTTYQLPSVGECVNSSAAEFVTLDLSSSDNPLRTDSESTYPSKQSDKGEEISTSSFEKFKQVGKGRGKLKLLIAEMKAKEQVSTESPITSFHHNDFTEKNEETSRGSRGRGQFLKKCLKSGIMGSFGSVSPATSYHSASNIIKNSENLSEACGGEILVKESEKENKELSKMEKAVIKPGEFSEFSDSNGLTEVSLSTEGDTGPPPLVGNCSVISNLDGSVINGGICDYEKKNEKCKSLSKSSEEPEWKCKKSKEPSLKKETVDLERLELKKPEEDRNVERRRNDCEFSEELSGVVASNKCCTPFVLFDDTVVDSVDTFKELPIQPSIIKNLEKGGTFNMLSQVQRWAIPAIRKQHNTLVIGSSKTGKTLSYIVPLIDYIQDEFYFEGLPRGNGPSVVILASSSRVCEAIYYACDSLLGHKNMNSTEKSNVRVLVVHGCGREENLWVDLTNGCDILISTPHCLVRLLEHPILTNFERLTCLVLDEIDVITQNPFRKNVRIILEKAQLSTKGRHYQKIFCGEKWTPQIERVVKTYVKTYALVVGSYQEAVIFKGIKPRLFLVDKSRKAEILFEILEENKSHSKIVIFCESTTEAIHLRELFSEKNIVPLVAHEKMLAESLMETGRIWKNLKESVLIMTDGVMSEFCIREAQILVHYDLPSRSKTNFFLRYSTVLNFYGKRRNLKKAQNQNSSEKVIILVDDENHHQLPHIADFVHRLGGEFPKVIRERCEEIQRLIETGKSNPICENLLSLGRCRNWRECSKRHAMVKARDSPEGLPISGWVSFAVVKVHNAYRMSATLLDHVGVDGKKSKFEDRRSETLAKVAEFFKEKDNHRPHGAPKVGDLCGVKSKDLGEKEEVFHRAEVIEYVKLDKHKMPLEVNVKLLDEGDIWRRKNSELYELPEELAELPPAVVDVRVVGLQPLDFDVSWSQMADAFVKQLMTQKLEENQFWSGKIVLSLRGSLFLDPIKRKEFLPHLNTVVFDMVLHGELLSNKIAVTNNEHLPPLLKLCKEVEMEISKKEERKKADLAKVQPQWAFFDSDWVEVVFLAAENISTVFLQSKKYEKLLERLEEDCQEEGTKGKNKEKVSKGKKSNASIETLSVGTFCLARFEDGKWNRGRIESEKEEQFEVFFIDHGDFLFVSKEDVVSIPEFLLLRLPCQAVECQLAGLEDDKCPLEVLQEIYAFSDNGKQTLFAQIINKDSKGSITNGKKYKVSLFDKRGVSLSKMLVDAEMIRAKESEKCYLENIKIEISEGEGESDEEIENEEENECNEEEQQEEHFKGEKVTTDLNISAKNSPDNYLINLKDEVFEDENALDFLKEFASKLFAKLEESEGIVITSRDKKLCTKPSSPQKSDSPRDFKCTKTAPPTQTLHEILELEKKRLCGNKRDFELKNQEKVLTPQVLWCQTQGEIRLKILLGSVTDYSFEVTHTNISFRCFQGEKFYAMGLKLFGAVNPEMTRITIKAFHVSVVLTKLAYPLWPRLHLDVEKHRWISLDVDGLKDEKNDMANRIKTATREIEAGQLIKGFRSETILPCSDSENSEGGEDDSDSDESDSNL